jgi:hypothetical protein
MATFLTASDLRYFRVPLVVPTYQPVFVDPVAIPGFEDARSLRRYSFSSINELLDWINKTAREGSDGLPSINYRKPVFAWEPSSPDLLEEVALNASRSTASYVTRVAFGRPVPYREPPKQSAPAATSSGSS